MYKFFQPFIDLKKKTDNKTDPAFPNANQMNKKVSNNESEEWCLVCKDNNLSSKDLNMLVTVWEMTERWSISTQHHTHWHVLSHPPNNMWWVYEVQYEEAWENPEITEF